MTEQERGPERISPVPLAAVFYGIVFALGLIWVALRDAWEPVSQLVAGTWGILAAAGAGLLLAAIVIAFSRWVRRFERARVLETEVREAMGPLRDGEVLMLALLSAVAEETFFRAAMQDAVGVWLTAVTFGVVHIVRGPGLALGMGFALVMGLLFGFLVDAGSGLLAVTLAHALINYVNLGRICGTR